MFDPETGTFAANMAMRKLTESGQVGYSETKILCSAKLEPYYFGRDKTFCDTGEGLSLTIGKRYIVKMDDGSYTAVCKKSGYGGGCLGNLALRPEGDNDTGESFLVMGGDDYTLIYDKNMGKSCTVIEENARHIESKYLVKTINLDGYIIGVSEYTLSEVIIGIFMDGGGTTSLGSMEQFWSDINTDGLLRLELSYGLYHFVIDQCVRLEVPSEKLMWMLSFSFLVYDETSNAFHTVSVCLNRLAIDNTVLFVKLT